MRNININTNKLSYYQKNKELCKIKNAAYRLKNLDTLRVKAKEYYQKNKYKILKNHQENKIYNCERWNQWRLNNLDKLKVSYEKNKPKRKLQLKERCKTDINFRLKNKLSNTLRTSVKKYGNGTKNISSIKLVGCSIEELKQHLQKQFKEGMTWSNHSFYGWHIDHIIPCCKFNLAKKEEQKKCFHYTNLQPLWARENLVKGGR